MSSLESATLPAWLEFVVFTAVNLGVAIYTWGKGRAEHGALKKTVNDDSCRIGKLERRLDPEDQNNRFVTLISCLECQTKCYKRNTANFHEVKELLQQNNKSLFSISGRISWIEGKLGREEREREE